MAKLLLAEDDEFSRDMLARRLQRNGYEVVSVADGREALAAALHHRPDVILMDLDMPVMDGRNAMRWLKTDVRTFKIPIIILSAHTSPENVAEALAAGCTSFEAKPVVLRRLMERIEEALQATSRKKAAGNPEG
jgi:CheY-like chemotaxis protein